MTIRVAVVDDQALVRRGFAMVLEHQPDIEVVVEAGTGVEAVPKSGPDKTEPNHATSVLPVIAQTACGISHASDTTGVLKPPSSCSHPNASAPGRNCRLIFALHHLSVIRVRPLYSPMTTRLGRDQNGMREVHESET